MDTYNIMIVGVGGQGTLLTSRVLGGLAEAAGYDVKLSEIHGMAQRGGSVVTFVRFGETIAVPVIEPGEADLLIAFEQLEALRYAHYLKPGGLIVMNNERIDPAPVAMGRASYPTEQVGELIRTHRVVHFDARSEAEKLGNLKVFNMVVLGAASRILPFSEDEWLTIIAEKVPPRTIDVNEQAFAAGRSLNPA